MKITFEQLSIHLKTPLLPLYLITGDEMLLRQETVRHIHTAAKQQGFEERNILHVDANFSWENFLTLATQQSLFSQRVLLELRMEANKFNETAQKALLAYCEKVPQDKLLLIVTGKLESKQQYTKCYKQIEQQGAVVQIWPLQGVKLQRFLQQRCQQAQLTLDKAALELLQELTEGNLTAATQAIEKLALMYGTTPVTASEVGTAISNSSYFDIFKLTDHLLVGNTQKTLFILATLKNEGTEPTIILWALLRELRTLIAMQTASQPSVKVWDSKKAILEAALRRKSLPQLYQLLQYAALIDLAIKGGSKDNVWLLLSEFCRNFCTA